MIYSDLETRLSLMRHDVFPGTDLSLESID